MTGPASGALASREPPAVASPARPPPEAAASVVPVELGAWLPLPVAPLVVPLAVSPLVAPLAPPLEPVEAPLVPVAPLAALPDDMTAPGLVEQAATNPATARVEDKRLYGQDAIGASGR
jgi:hypothetical protein